LDERTPLTAGGLPVGVYSDALSLIDYALRVFFSSHVKEFANVLLVSAVLAVSCWVGANYYVRLWNLRFRTTLIHQVLCSFAALCTLVFALLFASLKYTKPAADLVIDTWKFQIIGDPVWGSNSYRTAYQEVKALGLEDFSATLPPDQGGLIPATHQQSIKKFAEVYANAAVREFRTGHPFLSKILWARWDIPAKLIDKKATEFFRANPGAMYPAREAVNIAAEEIKSGLQAQTDRIVPVARTILILLFLIVQLIPFGIIGYAAYKDLKVTT